MQKKNERKKRKKNVGFGGGSEADKVWRLALNHGCFCCGRVSEAENYFLDEDKSKDEYSVMGRKKLTAWWRGWTKLERKELNSVAKFYGWGLCEKCKTGVKEMTYVVHCRLCGQAVCFCTCVLAFVDRCVKCVIYTKCENGNA